MSKQQATALERFIEAGWAYVRAEFCSPRRANEAADAEQLLRNLAPKLFVEARQAGILSELQSAVTNVLHSVRLCAGIRRTVYSAGDRRNFEEKVVRPSRDVKAAIEGELAALEAFVPLLNATAPDGTGRPTHQVGKDRAGPAAGKRGISHQEANVKARELLKADADFVNQTQRAWADAIGCSAGLVSKLPIWKAVMEQRRKGRKPKLPKPKAISLTDKLEATTGKGERDEVLKQLISGQEADHEPSPLEDEVSASPRTKAKARRQV